MSALLLSTLFPYTTLFRSTVRWKSSLAEFGVMESFARCQLLTSTEWVLASAVKVLPRSSARSEEHTSELQSRVDVVWRFLLPQYTSAVVSGIEMAVSSAPVAAAGALSVG